MGSGWRYVGAPGRQAPARLRLAFAGWGWGRRVAFLAGTAIGLGSIFSPLEGWGKDGLLGAHVAQHLALGDGAAPLLLLGLPPAVTRSLARRLTSIAVSPARSARLLTAVLSPVGALVVWALATYFWLLPPIHRLATPAGPVHLLDHLSFVVFGLVIWLGAFDPRPTKDRISAALRLGGLPWWGRHIYAMAARLAMLPPAIAIWVASPAYYHATTRSWSFSVTQLKDQELGASIMIGFEMLLFALAVALAFVFLSITEGRARRLVT